MQTFKKILVVEDDLSQKHFWEIVLRRHSTQAQIEWSVSSEEALRLIKEQNRQFDLIVADLFLAGPTTGIEFLNTDEVRNLNAESILVSAVEPEKLESHCRRLLPRTKIISKPLNVVKCERALAEL